MVNSYLYLGWFRFVLALLVVVQHWQAATPPAPWQQVLESYEVGSVAVLCFFVVSGFIILEAVHRYYQSKPFKFIANRLLRLYPIYIVALALQALAIYLTPQIPTQLTGLTSADLSLGVLIANLLAPLPGGGAIIAAFNAPVLLTIVWALRVEFIFYFTLFIVVLCFGRKAKFSALVLRGSAFILVLSIIFSDQIRNTSLQYIPYFVLGMSFFYIARLNDKNLMPIAIATAISAFLFSVFQILTQDPFHIIGFERDTVVQTIIFAAGLLCFLVSIRFSHHVSEQRALWLSTVDRQLGDLSYPVYLVHLQVIFILGSMLLLLDGRSLWVVLLLSVIVAYVLEKGVQPRIAALRDSLRSAPLAH